MRKKGPDREGGVQESNSRSWGHWSMGKGLGRSGALQRWPPTQTGGGLKTNTELKLKLINLLNYQGETKQHLHHLCIIQPEGGEKGTINPTEPIINIEHEYRWNFA